MVLFRRVGPGGRREEGDGVRVRKRRAGLDDSNSSSSPRPRPRFFLSFVLLFMNAPESQDEDLKGDESHINKVVIKEKLGSGTDTQERERQKAIPE